MIIKVNENNTLKTFNIFDSAIIADTFNSNTAYAVGDYVFYGNSLYRFISAHSAGAWNSNEVSEVTIVDEIVDAKNSKGDAGTYITVDVAGASPTITAEAGICYICGEVTSISIIPPSIGVCDVIFTSGSTVAVLTLPNTVKMPSWFDVNSLRHNTIYEISIIDGVYGAVMTWEI